MPLYEEILKAAAEEAAAAATDAFGPGFEPTADMAYEFICGVWEDADEPAAAYLPTEMPAEFAAAVRLLDQALAANGANDQNSLEFQRELRQRRALYSEGRSFRRGVSRRVK